MAYLVAAILGLAFGAGDQYLGTLLWVGPWTATAAQVSAPWLILPFVAGLTQERPRKAAVLGLIVTASALFGYFAMTYSPMEIHPWSLHRFTTGMIAVTTRGWYNPAYIAAGLVTGPVFGLLGNRWRVSRSWVSAALVVGVLCLEPAARWTSGQLMPPAPVWTIEVAAGAIVGVIFAVSMMNRRRARLPVSASSR